MRRTLMLIGAVVLLVVVLGMAMGGSYVKTECVFDRIEARLAAIETRVDAIYAMLCIDMPGDQMSIDLAESWDPNITSILWPVTDVGLFVTTELH